MRSAAPPLLPIFRSDGQARLLARIFLDDRPASVSAIARELGLTSGAISREADRLEEAGLIVSERFGNQRILRAEPDSPYFAELHTLLSKAFGPLPALRDRIRRVRGVEEAYIFGSWAERYEGTKGRRPNDIDLLIVGKPDRQALARRLREVWAETGYEVNPTIVARTAWDNDATAFLRAVKDGPLITL